MATLYIGLAYGSNDTTEPTTGTSSTGLDIEITIRDTAQVAGITRTQVGDITSRITEWIANGGLAGANIPIL
jgi:hypothetical protein